MLQPVPFAARPAARHKRPLCAAAGVPDSGSLLYRVGSGFRGFLLELVRAFFYSCLTSRDVGSSINPAHIFPCSSFRQQLRQFHFISGKLHVESPCMAHYRLAV